MKLPIKDKKMKLLLIVLITLGSSLTTIQASAGRRQTPRAGVLYSAVCTLNYNIVFRVLGRIYETQDVNSGRRFSTKSKAIEAAQTRGLRVCHKAINLSQNQKRDICKVDELVPSSNCETRACVPGLSCVNKYVVR